MRNPFRSEAEAFGFVLVCVALFAAVALAGILAGGWVALAVFVVLAVAVALYVKGEPKPPDEPVLSRQGATAVAFSLSRTRRSPAARFAARSSAARAPKRTSSSSARL